MAYETEFAPMSLERYKIFRTYASLSWDTKPRIVYKFSHTLTQYLPSAYAEIYMSYPKSEINTFLKIEEIPIVSRALTVSCITDGFGPNTLYNNFEHRRLFGGPWRLIVNDYQVVPMPQTMLADENNPEPTESYLVILKCVDRVWYSMTQEEKFGVYSRRQFQSISDCVRQILKTHQARGMEVDDTTVSFNWLQSKMTDYEFIRSVLAYCNPPGFHFFCNNEVGYFKPIGTVGSAGTINVDIRGTQVDTLMTTINKQYLEKVSDGAVIVPYGEGLNDSAHVQREAVPMGGAGTEGGGKKYIKFSIDNEAIKQAFSANVSFRTRMFGRITKLKTTLMTDFNPLYTLHLANNAPDKYPSLSSGDYYIVSIKNIIGWNISWPEVPHSWVVLAKGE